ncbi:MULTISPECIES: M20/M25/M40 family metallo-hydrolase [unclassified Kribbella]|uniref:M20/M25/M40 family metallo-hydrolase n=1 Tax=unclassified Kribbella TaxID=2644121 RepID=UPI003077B873
MTTGQAVARVMEYVTRDRLAEAICGVVDIPSPTGAEAMVANWIVDDLTTHGVAAKLQQLDHLQANAVGTVAGGNGPSTLLYAPLDTFTTGDPTYDVPSATLAMRPDMLPRATLYGDLVQGLGAGNPKGHAACVMVTLAALAESGVELPGDVVGGFGAGGMPSFAIEVGRQNTGHGVGAAFLLERGFTTDYAVIAKPGWTVSHEEVGLVWLDVLVPGIHTYAGSRHRLPYRNGVALAGEVAGHLESWLDEYAVRHEHGTMRPQGIVSSISGGSERLAASTAALVRLRLDLRITTAQTPAGVTREVRTEVERLGEKLGAELRVEQVAAVPASHTSPDEPIVRAAVAAWEAVAGERHVPIMANSGATDANILRMRGVPTARVGMPKVPATPTGEPPDFTAGMNLADLGEMRRLVEILVRTVLFVERL